MTSGPHENKAVEYCISTDAGLVRSGRRDKIDRILRKVQIQIISSE